MATCHDVHKVANKQVSSFGIVRSRHLQRIRNNYCEDVKGSEREADEEKKYNN